MRELSPREKEVAELIAAGFSPRDIGKQLVMSPRTVSVHAHNIRIKTGHRTTWELYQFLSGSDANKNSVLYTREERITGLEWAWRLTSASQKAQLLKGIEEMDKRAHGALQSVPSLIP